MPNYDRHCQSCDHLYEVTCKISEKDNKHECPSCGSTDGVWQISAPNITMNSHRFGSSPDKKTGFHEVVSRMAERHPNTEIAKRAT